MARRQVPVFDSDFLEGLWASIDMPDGNYNQVIAPTLPSGYRVHRMDLYINDQYISSQFAPFSSSTVSFALQGETSYLEIPKVYYFSYDGNLIYVAHVSGDKRMSPSPSSPGTPTNPVNPPAPNPTSGCFGGTIPSIGGTISVISHIYVPPPVTPKICPAWGCDTPKITPVPIPIVKTGGTLNTFSLPAFKVANSISGGTSSTSGATPTPTGINSAMKSVSNIPVSSGSISSGSLSTSTGITSQMQVGNRISGIPLTKNQTTTQTAQQNQIITQQPTATNTSQTVEYRYSGDNVISNWFPNQSWPILSKPYVNLYKVNLETTHPNYPFHTMTGFHPRFPSFYWWDYTHYPNDMTLVATVTPTQLSAVGGAWTYSFSNLQPGTYVVTLDHPTLQPYYTNYVLWNAIDWDSDNSWIALSPDRFAVSHNEVMVPWWRWGWQGRPFGVGIPYHIVVVTSNTSSCHNDFLLGQSVSLDYDDIDQRPICMGCDNFTPLPWPPLPATTPLYAKGIPDKIDTSNILVQDSQGNWSSLPTTSQAASQITAAQGNSQGVSGAGTLGSAATVKSETVVDTKGQPVGNTIDSQLANTNVAASQQRLKTSPEAPPTQGIAGLDISTDWTNKG